MIEKRGNRIWYKSARSFFKRGKKGRVVHVVATMSACLAIGAAPLNLSRAVELTINGPRATTYTIPHNPGTTYNLTVTDSGSIEVTNANGIEATLNGGVQYPLTGTSVINNGTISVSSTTNNVFGGIYLSYLYNSSSITNAGTIEINGTKAFVNLGVSAYVLSGSQVENSGTIEINSSSGVVDNGIFSYFMSGGTILNSGTIDIESSGDNSYSAGIYSVYSMANSTITNSGTIELDHQGDNTDSIGICALYSWGTHVTNSGTIEIDNSGKNANLLGVASVAINGGTTENSGTIKMDNTGDGSMAVGMIGVYGMGSSVENSGTITITNQGRHADLSGILRYYSDNETITNSGTIEIASSGASSDARGIFLEYSYSGTTMENSGAIEINNQARDSYATGIYIYELSDTAITNSGNITITDAGEGATIVGIYVASVDSNSPGTIENSGSIALEAQAVDSAVGIEVLGSTPVTNSGVIEVSAQSAGRAAGIYSGSANARVINTGIVRVSLDSAEYEINGSTIDTWACAIQSVGDVVNSGTVSISLGSGDLRQGLYSVYTLGSLTNAGTLSGTFYAGDTINSGTIKLACGTSSVQGNFVQTAEGSLDITVNTQDPENVQYPKVTVAGTASLADGTRLNVDVLGFAPALIGRTLTGVIESDTAVNVDVDALNIIEDFLLIDFQASLSADNTSLDLTVEQEISIARVMQEFGLPGLAGAGTVLGGIGSTTDPELQAFLERLYVLSTVDQVARQVLQAVPMGASQTPALVRQLLSAMGTIVQNRQGGRAGLNSGDPVFNDKSYWVKPFAGFMEQDDAADAYGFTADTYGLGMGVDGEFAPGRRLGVSLFFSKVEADTNHVPQDSDMDVVNLMLYGSRPLIPEKDVILFWQAGAGIQDTVSSRYLAAVNATAKADYTSRALFGQVRAVKAFKVNETLTLTGGAAVSYTWFSCPSYSESGAGGMNLAVEGDDTQALVPGLEGGLSFTPATGVDIKARVFAGYDVMDEDASVTSRFQGAGPSFTIEGMEPSPLVYTAGVGLVKTFCDRFSMAANYDLEGRGDDFMNHMVSCKFTWKF